MPDPPPIETSLAGVRGNREERPETTPQPLHGGTSVAAARRAPLVAGQHVRARGLSWRVAHIEAWGACRVLTLLAARRAREPASLALLAPFDHIVPVRGPTGWRTCSPRHAAAALAAAVRETVADGVGTLLGSELSLVSWQWAAATMLARGEASVVLLADAVGLGKTIEAALAIAALRARGDAGRVLILTPAGLREQWHEEIERLFRFSSTIVDAAWLRGARRTMPVSVNPWKAVSAAIASIDFVKQPEVLAAAAATPWDMLVIDEAHTLSARSDRRAAAAALAACARHVLLLTATPHTGSDDEFAALCGVGALAGDGAQMRLIRRTRADVGFDGSRRVRVARLALSEPERRMHAQVREYAGAVWRERGRQSPAARLAMTVLLKRAASSAWALQCSVAHRLRLLGSEEDVLEQPLLPFDDPGETDAADTEVADALGEPGLGERGRELQMLVALRDAARIAAAAESKLARVAALLRRTSEPAIVFTEYRDTLYAACRALAAYGPLAVLHGGLSRAERRDAERVFTAGAARVLVATDVASEGLNLQARCRVVINLELPWNPIRLEQRIGRVDRIGQRRRVHAVHLVGVDTAESYVLERLAARVRAIRRSLGRACDATTASDTLLAAGALGEADVQDLDPPPAPRGVPAPAPNDPGERRLCELLDLARRLDPQHERRVTSSRKHERLPMALVRRRVRTRLGLEPGVVLGFRVEARAETGRTAAAAILAIHVRLAPRAVSSTRPSVLVAAVLPLAREAALGQAASALGAGLDVHRQYTARARARESALLGAAAPDTSGDPPAPIQPGLFDRRALHEAARQHAAREHRRQVHAVRLAQLALEARHAPGARAEPVVALVLR